MLTDRQSASQEDDLICSFNWIIHLITVFWFYDLQFGLSDFYARLLAALQRNKKPIIPHASRVRKIHPSNTKEMYKKGQPEPKGEKAEERTASQVNSLVSMTMADKMDESVINEWRRTQYKD